MNKYLKIFPILLIFCIILTSACSRSEKASPSPTPIETQPPQPSPTQAPEPTISKIFPVTAEDSIIEILATYRKEGLDTIRNTWLTNEFAAQGNFTDFLATMIGEAPSIPAALMGWEILKVEPDQNQGAAPGAVSATIKTSYQSSVVVCRLITLSSPGTTGDHWRISNSKVIPCDGVVSAIGTQAPIQQPTATSGGFVWWPCGSAAPPSQLQIGNNAYVSPIPPLAMNIHQEPNSNPDNVVGLINPGEVITLSDGPRCADGFVYWKTKIVTQNTPGMIEYFEGWVAEGEVGRYWLLPCPATGPCGGGFVPVRTPFVPPIWLTQRAK